jgi:hypothetical protein
MADLSPYPLLLALLSLGHGPCEVQAPVSGDAAAVSDGGGVAPHRQVLFAAFDLGEFRGGSADGVQLGVGPFGGAGPSAQIEHRFAASPDLVLACATLIAAPPETHGRFTLVYNDDGGDVSLLAYDGVGQALGQAASTRALRGSATREGDAYLSLPAAVADPTRPLARIDVGSCGGIIHAVEFD